MNIQSVGIPELSLRYLKAAIYVVRYRSVTQAARKLNRSQTAITKAISDLEAQLGVTLFDRSSVGMLPTVYGEALAKRVSQAMNEFEAAGRICADFNADKRTCLNNPIFSMDISYKRLAAFLALYESCEISAAADKLGITRAAMYNSTRQVESLLEMPLFERHPAGVSPTPYCRVLARHIKLAFAEIRHAVEDIANLNGVVCGKVAVGALPYTRSIIVPRAINRLLEENHDIDVRTNEGDYDHLIGMLRGGDLDFVLGAIRTQSRNSDVKVEHLYKDHLSIIARKGHPLEGKANIQFSELEKYGWVLPLPNSPARDLFVRLHERHGTKVPEHVVSTSSLAMFRGLLLESDHIALLSEHQVYYELKHGLLTVLHVNTEDSYRMIGVTMRAHTSLSPAAQLFLENLRNVAKEIACGIREDQKLIKFSRRPVRQVKQAAMQMNSV